MSPGLIDAAIAENGVWRPSVKLGDVLAFDSMIPHRTTSEPSHTKPRISAELRFAPLNGLMRQHLAAYPRPCFHVSGRTHSGPRSSAATTRANLSPSKAETGLSPDLIDAARRAASDHFRKCPAASGPIPHVERQFHM
jgi:hypothetical protein